MRLIYRVDDRFIHGQVIEGWINYYHIPNIIIVNDFIFDDVCSRMIYESVLPAWASLSFYKVDEFATHAPNLPMKGSDTLVLLGSVTDLLRISDIIGKESYINIGCIAMGGRNYAVNDTVYLDSDELCMLASILEAHSIFAHKLPWEHPIDIEKFLCRLRDAT